MLAFSEFILCEQVVNGNGWRKLANFMSTAPGVFPRVTPNPDGSYDVEDTSPVELTDLQRDYYRMNLEEETVEEPEDDLTAEICALGERISAEVDYSQLDALGLTKALYSPAYLVRNDAGELRILPFGREFGSKRWAATSRMMPVAGSGMSSTAQFAKTGDWVIKDSMYNSDYSPDPSEFDAMSRHSTVCASVRGYMPKSGRYWQAKLDEQGWKDMVESQPEKAAKLFATLEDNIKTAMAQDPDFQPHDYDMNRNVGLDAHGNPKLFDY
jgi:hypothetical protein